MKNTTSSSASASDNTLDNKPKGGNYRRRNTASCGLNVLSQARGVKSEIVNRGVGFFSQFICGGEAAMYAHTSTETPHH